MIEIILDTETTGLTPSTDKIIEIACIELDNHTPTGKKVSYVYKPRNENYRRSLSNTWYYK